MVAENTGQRSSMFSLPKVGAEGQQSQAPLQVRRAAAPACPTPLHGCR